MSTLHLMVGLPCSGKTTLARQLEHKYSALRLTTDEWHTRLFGQDANDKEHDARHDLIAYLTIFNWGKEKNYVKITNIGTKSCFRGQKLQTIQCKKYLVILILEM